MMGNYGPMNPHMVRSRGTRKVLKGYDECAKYWAEQRQDEGKTTGGRMFFVGRTLYSYGYHFPLGHILTIPKSEATLVLLNKDRYSATTSKHQWAARSAAGQEFPDSRTFEVGVRVIGGFISGASDTLRPACSLLFTSDLAEAKEFMSKAERARQRKDEHIRSALYLLQRSNRMAELLGMTRPFSLDDDTAHDAVRFALALTGKGDHWIYAENAVKKGIVT